MGNRKVYSLEFKAEALKRLEESNMSVANVALDLGVAYGTLCKWVFDHKRRKLTDIDLENESDQAKIKRLERENKDLKLEHEILKKAAVFFAKNTK